MRRAKHKGGSRIFNKSKSLGFFSRLTKTNTYTTDKSEDDINVEMYDEQQTKTEHDIQEIAKIVMGDFELQHPIMLTNTTSVKLHVSRSCQSFP